MAKKISKRSLWYHVRFGLKKQEEDDRWSRSSQFSGGWGRSWKKSKHGGRWCQIEQLDLIKRSRLVICCSQKKIYNSTVVLREEIEEEIHTINRFGCREGYHEEGRRKVLSNATNWFYAQKEKFWLDPIKTNMQKTIKMRFGLRARARDYCIDLNGDDNCGTRHS